MNRLARETSPYLRQHAANPVDWHPWGEEAFARARAERKPVFLSVGYSTCHWCHVMARESFEDPAIAALLNEHFVAVKVDREERPDVDHVYMSYVQALTGHGGWPLSAWLTPELRPFFGGTYFPPEDRAGRPGFATVLRAIARAWREDPGKLAAEGDNVAAALAAAAGGDAPAGAPAGGAKDALARDAAEAFERGFRFFHESFDPARGGFGGAPKFPRAGALSFLFRCAVRAGAGRDAGRAAAHMAAHTLRRMAGGGIHDHVGGGFHRYSVDADWFVPHFEKMLYDQAQIAGNALEAWQATGDERHAWLARDIVEYVLRDLRDPEGGFYSAEDADSGHREGAFYLWTKAEVDSLLGPEAALLCDHFGVAEGGNVPPGLDPQGEFRGGNILAQRRPLEETARRAGLDPAAASGRIAAALEGLRSARGRRPRPQRDEKILTSWNGLMISALARAAVVPAAALDEVRADGRSAAEAAAGFIERRLFDPARGVLFRSWCGGRGAAEGFAEDYAFLIQGLLDLYEAAFDFRWLRWADRLQAKMDELFWDEARGGYFNSAAGAPDLIVRLKEDYDGAVPAASSVAASNLLRLDGAFGGRRERAERTLEAFRARWLETPQALPEMLCAAALAAGPPRHVVIAGDPGAADFRALAAVLHEGLWPRRTLLAADGGPAQAELAARSPWIAGMRPRGGRTTAYVCEDFACRAPIADPDELRRTLDAG